MKCRPRCVGGEEGGGGHGGQRREVGRVRGHAGHGGGRVLVEVSEGFEDSAVKIYFFFNRAG